MKNIFWKWRMYDNFVTAFIIQQKWKWIVNDFWKHQQFWVYSLLCYNMYREKEVGEHMQEFTVEFYDNKDFLITTYVIHDENIKQALEQAKNEAYHLINIGVCVPFTVSVLNDDDHLVYKTMTKKTERYY